ncbi:hypothetical protein GCM10011571_28480 [Marinithermofilum abyssi]|uniref:DUF456 domain-containing protein n=1 Tax=Marinithermofilum abyssi TaxID=1571185 RepID=A0A8J2YDB3_9BACL|nr:DUF456 family protein [Marinithermofilum abyssi]GGE24633.1 hypothetical protein GCM10011571_28480 [Marinithermofilum abyssi]
METLWWSIIILLFVSAYMGLVLPVLPDAPLMLGGFLLYHFLIDDQALSWSFWVTAVVLTVLLFATDYLAGAVAAKTYGASKTSIWAAVAGALLFSLVMGPAGFIVGPLVSVIAVEMAQKKSWQQAVKTGLGTLVGFLGGIFLKGVLMTGMLVWFLVLVL